MNALPSLFAAALLVAPAPAQQARTSPVAPAAQQLVLATYKIAGEGSVATALALRSPDGLTWLATSKHVLESMKGDRFTLVARRRDDSGVYFRKERKLPLRKDDKPLWTGSEKHDLAVIPVKEPGKLFTLPLSCLADDAKLAAAKAGPGSTVRISCFPAQLESNGAGLPITRGGVVASFPLVPLARHPRILIDMTSFEGDSGGPVALASGHKGKPLIIGLISRRHFSEAKVKGEPPKRPFQLAEAVPAIFLAELLKKAE